MLTINDAQLGHLARSALLRQLVAFVALRTGDAAVRQLLADPQACYEFLTPLYRSDLDDHGQAVRLAAALVAKAHGGDPMEALRMIDTAPDPEHAAKLMLEQSGALRYCEFDIE